MDRPWLKFYPADWRADPALRMCSIAARGLWIEMLCIMHEADPRGSLVINGRTVEAKQLAGLVGVPEPDLVPLMAELADAGVFSRKRTGVVFSRRMERDEIKSRKNKENGRMGGNPTLCKQTEKEEPVNPGDKARDDRDLDARDQKEEKIPSETSSEGCPKRKRVRTPANAEFEEFWKLYPTDSLMSKKQAYQAFVRLSEADRKRAIQSVPAFVGYCQGHPDYRPVHANRFLSQRRFEGFEATQAKIAQRTFIKEESPQWFAWQEYGKRTRGKGYPTRTQQVNGHLIKGWDFPAEWPPDGGGAYAH